MDSILGRKPVRTLSCDLLDSVLTLKPVRRLMALDEKFMEKTYIRFVDTSQAFRDCSIYHTTDETPIHRFVFTYFPLDLNAGYYRDIVIYNEVIDDNYLKLHLYMCKFHCTQGYPENRVRVEVLFKKTHDSYEMVNYSASGWD
jgi:hypothetical protein